MSSSPPMNNVNMSPRARRGSSTSSKAAESKALLEMNQQIIQKDAALHAMALRMQRLESEVISLKSNAVAKDKRTHVLAGQASVISDKGRKEKELGRSSMATNLILETLTKTQKDTPEQQRVKEICKKLIRVFSNPHDYIEYLSSSDFANSLLEICECVMQIFAQESKCLFLQSPCYVIGDIHGNLEDLHFFSDNVWKLGMDLTAGQFLFLGDYIDRGRSGLECIAYLFAMKVLYPKKIMLLRGNHEVRDVNGWEEHYGAKSFIWQCKDRFGTSGGETVWEKVNQVFDRLPLAAIIDHDIFCIHGGIPRPLYDQNNRICRDEVTSILGVPAAASVMPAGPHEPEDIQQTCLDCLWSDPAPEEMEPSLDDDGFGESPRGGGAICFGNTAIDNFLTRNNLSYIIRAHEAHAEGVALSKSARVFTVFSTSQDHRQGARAMAGCVLVDTDTIKVINRSAKYKNKYVHRRSSISLEGLSEEQLQDRKKLGLVRYSMAPSGVLSESDSENDSPDKKPQVRYNTIKGGKGNSENVDVSNKTVQGGISLVNNPASPEKTNRRASTGSPGSSVFQNLVPSWLSKAV